MFLRLCVAKVLAPLPAADALWPTSGGVIVIAVGGADGTSPAAAGTRAGLLPTVAINR